MGDGTLTGRVPSTATDDGHLKGRVPFPVMGDTPLKGRKLSPVMGHGQLKGRVSSQVRDDGPLKRRVPSTEMCDGPLMGKCLPNNRGVRMSRVSASCSGRLGNPKVVGSNPDLTVFKPWSSQTSDFKIDTCRSLN